MDDAIRGLAVGAFTFGNKGQQLASYSYICITYAVEWNGTTYQLAKIPTNPRPVKRKWYQVFQEPELLWEYNYNLHVGFSQTYQMTFRLEFEFGEHLFEFMKAAKERHQREFQDNLLESIAKARIEAEKRA